MVKFLDVFLMTILFSYDFPMASSLKLIYCDFETQLHSGTRDKHLS